MIYDGKSVAINMQKDLLVRTTKLSHTPVMAIISVGEHQITSSFIKIKKVYAEKIGVTIKEFNFPVQENEAPLVSEILDLAESNAYDGIIVQLPLPRTYDVTRVLDAVPMEMDVDVLSTKANASFVENNAPLPPVVGAVACILLDTHTDLGGKKIVVVGHGKLVGAPVAMWLRHQGVNPQIIDIDTDDEDRRTALKEADVIITGAGIPNMIRPEHIKTGVILIDAGTSEQDGTLSGDCDRACAEVASVLTPVPGGVGPLTVACLYENLISNAENGK